MQYKKRHFRLRDVSIMWHRMPVEDQLVNPDGDSEGDGFLYGEWHPKNGLPAQSSCCHPLEIQAWAEYYEHVAPAIGNHPGYCEAEKESWLLQKFPSVSEFLFDPVHDRPPQLILP